MSDASRPLVAPLQREHSFTQRTLRTVRSLILAGRYRPGEWINEVDLAQQLGVSRGPVREALQQLASEGLVVRIQNRGTFIPEFSAAETKELFELREAMEVMAARLAAQRASPEAIADLRRILESTSRRMDDAEAPYPHELDFHSKIISLAGNNHLRQRAEEVHGQLFLARSRSGAVPDRARQAYKEHLEILAAIESRDPERAEQLMRKHLQAAAARFWELAKQAGDQPA